MDEESNLVQNLLLLNKKEGETPLAAIKRFVRENPSYENLPMGYAGRLDPMASGLLLILVGDENKVREKYLGLPKTYESEILLGVATDTFDILGKITNFSLEKASKESIAQTLAQFKGKITQTVPAYSAIHVNKRPLFVWARENRLSEISIPSREVMVDRLELVGMEGIDSKALENEVLNRINTVEGDFRQTEIISLWKKLFSKVRPHEFAKVKIRVDCSSGTYIRSIANDVGAKLGIGGLAYSIKRIKIGDFLLDS
jgi:tRNA pseudouridine55 synthase